MSLRSEAIRYLGMKDERGISPLLDDAIVKANNISPQCVFSEFEITKTNDGILLPDGTKLYGELAKNSLQDSNKVILLTATLTYDADRYINTATSTSSQAVINAVMSAKVEEHLDYIEDELIKKYKAKGLFLTPRFSPGYGDLPLTLNADILRLTFAEKYIGVKCTENYMLLPVKSVTAIIGISNIENKRLTHKCANCTKQCIYRKNS